MTTSSARVKTPSPVDSDPAVKPLSTAPAATPAPRFSTYAGIFFTSASVLLLELALTRIFSVLLWAHLAFMVVGTALFGFGLSGVFLALGGRGRLGRSFANLGLLCFVMAFSIIGCYLVVTNVPFQMWSFLENPANYLYLGIWYIALVVPFFLAGLIVAELLSTYSHHSSRLYGVDLIGAAAGSLTLIPIIPVFGAEGTVVCAALFAMIAAFALTSRERVMLRNFAILAVVVLGFILPRADTVLPLKFHQGKRRFMQAVANNHIYATRWSTLSRVDIGYHDKRTFDIWIDGGTNESAIFKWSGNESTLKPMYFSSIGTVYDLKQGTSPRVMIIGPAGGKEVLVALSYGASSVDAVEMDPSIVELVNQPKYANFMGRLYQNPRVRLINDEGRSFLRRQPSNSYDVIQSVNNYTPVAISSGALNLSEAFLFTKEAFGDYLDRLTPDGVLALHRGAALRLALTAVEVLSERGYANPAQHILISSGEVPHFDGFYLKRSPWTAPEVDRISKYLEGRPLQGGRKFLWNPLSEEGNHALYQQILRSPVDQHPAYYKSLGVNLFPVTDDRPFIEHFLRFGRQKLSPNLPGEFRRRDQDKWRGIVPLGDFPYIAILAESAVLALLFIGVPLFVFAGSSRNHPYFSRFIAYFACLGFSFIVVEICLMKRYVLFLGNPAYSITTVLVALLCGAGIGSMATSHLGKKNPASGAVVTLAAVALAVALEALVSPQIFAHYLALSFSARVAIASLALLPLGFVMGMPFPMGLRLISLTCRGEEDRRKMVAWAWGVNGYTTVVGSAATVFVALFFGFKAALAAAVCGYLIALFSLRGIRLSD